MQKQSAIRFWLPLVRQFAVLFLVGLSAMAPENLRAEQVDELQVAEVLNEEQLTQFLQNPNVKVVHGQTDRFKNFRYLKLTGKKYPDQSCRYTRTGRFSPKTRGDSTIYAFVDFAEDRTTCEVVIKAGPLNEPDVAESTQSPQNSGLTIYQGQQSVQITSPVR